MPFYCMGQVYKGLEKYDKLNNIAYFIVLLIIQTLLMHKFKNLTYNLNLLSFMLLYTILGISVPLLVKYFYEKTINKYKDKKEVKS